MKYFLYHLKRRMLFLFSLFFMRPMNILTREETILYILENKCSMARFGNGELDIIIGDNKQFQRYDKKLADDLKRIKTNKELLVCVPYLLENKQARSACSNNFYKRHRMLYLYYWRKLFSRNTILGDATLTRFYYDSDNKSPEYIKDYLEKLNKLWEKRDVVFVEGEFTRLGVGNDLFDNVSSKKRIICPSENAYDILPKIEEFIINNFSPCDSYLFLVALGPTATVLASHLSNKGYQALDIGHVDIEYEWFLRGVKDEKTSIPNKYVNEAPDGRIINDDYQNTSYNNEIIKKIL